MYEDVLKRAPTYGYLVPLDRHSMFNVCWVSWSTLGGNKILSQKMKIPHPYAVDMRDEAARNNALDDEEAVNRVYFE